MVEFISYDGEYPNLCNGILKLRIEDKELTFPRYSLTSGGCVEFDEDWIEHISSGRWIVDVPKKYAAYKEEIEKVVNENVPWGCCGGCV